MAEKFEIYKCEKCGNIVEVLHGGAGTLTCCDQPMKKLEEQTADTSQEKHVPYIAKESNGYRIKVGENQEHPMADNHYIEFIEIIVDNSDVYRKYLSPGEKPEAFFEVSGGSIVAREFCNIHGLWKNEG